ncbi:MAG: tRNA methyl transferase PRC-barrel domain-containing protein, partial [Gaiellaceae bacterium]
SQEACFLAGGDYRAFLERQGLEGHDGPILDETGREVGRHAGSWRFTPGQRRGIGVAAGEPLYALRTDATTNTLTIGPLGSLASRRVEVRGRLYVPVAHAEAKLRYRSEPTGARVERMKDGFALLLDEPAYAVAPGQTAVLYDDEAVVGAGVIEAAA